MKLRKLNLQEHQQVLYEILYTVDNFCKEHKIRYCLAYGSLIGAVRHHGIIPGMTMLTFLWKERNIIDLRN